MSSTVFLGPIPRVFGHRGAAGLAPENTLPSFALALAMGADILELDVHGTRDGAIVVIHDATLDRTTDGTGPVAAYSLAQLQRLDAGYRFTWNGHEFPYRGQGVRICTLEELLRELPLVHCNVEIKQAEPPIVADVLAIIRRSSARHRVLLAAEHAGIMNEIRRQGDDMATSFSAAEVAEFIGRVQTDSVGGYHPAGVALQIPPRFGDLELVTAATVSAAHDLGLEMHVWTINDRDEMERLLTIGVDGLISDLPGLARVATQKRRKG